MFDYFNYEYFVLFIDMGKFIDGFINSIASTIEQFIFIIMVIVRHLD